MVQSFASSPAESVYCKVTDTVPPSSLMESALVVGIGVTGPVAPALQLLETGSKISLPEHSAFLSLEGTHEHNQSPSRKRAKIWDLFTIILNLYLTWLIDRSGNYL